MFGQGGTVRTARSQQRTERSRDLFILVRSSTVDHPSIGHLDTSIFRHDTLSSESRDLTDRTDPTR